ncbi:unnamed protein product [Allacma fusca]|uniref:Very-long-chain 3-oxoacyl-CoA synthase n=1 Tax=Allacma fusca TaxID=39272 RepID=A0A8J2PIT3_9HEXA|nr:unnamed protein product [Allacma fusca]
MIQFIMISGHAFQLCFVECNYPIAFVWWIGLHGVLFLVLFSNFYKKSYKIRRNSNNNNNTTKGRAIRSTDTAMLTNGKSSLVNGNGTTHNGHSNGYQNGHVDSNSNGIKLKAY